MVSDMLRVPYEPVFPDVDTHHRANPLDLWFKGFSDRLEGAFGAMARAPGGIALLRRLFFKLMSPVAKIALGVLGPSIDSRCVDCLSLATWLLGFAYASVPIWSSNRWKKQSAELRYASNSYS